METWGRKWASPTRWVWRFLSTLPKNCPLLTLRTCPRNFTVIMILVFLFSVRLDYWIFWDINVHLISALISYFWNWIDKLNSNHSNSIKIKSHKFLNANRPDIRYMYMYLLPLECYFYLHVYCTNSMTQLSKWKFLNDLVYCPVQIKTNLN